MSQENSISPKNKVLERIRKTAEMDRKRETLARSYLDYSPHYVLLKLLIAALVIMSFVVITTLATFISKLIAPVISVAGYMIPIALLIVSLLAVFGVNSYFECKIEDTKNTMDYGKDLSSLDKEEILKKENSRYFLSYLFSLVAGVIITANLISLAKLSVNQVICLCVMMFACYATTVILGILLPSTFSDEGKYFGLSIAPALVIPWLFCVARPDISIVTYTVAAAIIAYMSFGSSRGVYNLIIEKEAKAPDYARVLAYTFTDTYLVRRLRRANNLAVYAKAKFGDCWNLVSGW